MDSGWSWIVCAAAFITHTLNVGFSYAIGVYYVEFLTVFNESKGTTAWISSLNYGCLCGIGPIGSLIIHRCGHRVTMFVGGIVAALGLFISAFATNIYVVFLSFGILTGTGSGISYTAAVVSISAYFLRLRPLALGLSLCGGGIGNILFPWITTFLISRFGWRGALIISSGLLLHICVAEMLLMKPKPDKKNRIFREIKLEIPDKLNKEVETSSEYDKTVLINQSVKSITQSIFSNFQFIVLLLNIFMFLFGSAVVSTHITAFAESEGISASFSNMMISALGLFSILGRICLSSLSQLPWINTIWLYIFAVFFCGFATIVLAVWTSPVGMMICSSVIGFFLAAFGPTVAECACLLLGPRLFNFGYGYLMVLMGVGWLLGAPAAGILYDATQHYPNSFYLGGGVAIFGAIVMAPAGIGFSKSITLESEQSNEEIKEITKT